VSELGEREPVHILHNQNQDRFIQEIPQLIFNLSKELEIDISELDKTLESLLVIDKAIENKNRPSYIDNDDNKKILGSLIAYIGEVLKTAINGGWFIKKYNEQAWEPVIVSSSGQNIHFVLWYLMNFMKQKKVASMISLQC